MYMQHEMANNATFLVKISVVFFDRTKPASSIEKGLAAAQARGLIDRHAGGVVPTERGFDFLSDLQALFLAD